MKRIYLIILLAFPGGGLMAQTSSLGFGTTTFSKDTLPYNDTLYIQTFVKNLDTATYSDSLAFGLKINGILNVSQAIFPNPFAGQQVNIVAGDSMPTLLRLVITPSYLQLGPDILVIWPIAKDGSAAHDSLMKTIFVIAPNDIEDESNLKVKLFYSNEQIFIQELPTDAYLNRVRIYDLTGRLILDESSLRRNSVPFNNAPEGLYFAEFIFNDQQRRVLKFVK